MAFTTKKKTDTGKKKKGPKGKRARAKAKLDRQWGETIIDESSKLQKFRRHGKSRLLPATVVDESQLPSRRTTSKSEQQETPNNDEVDRTNMSLSSDDDDDHEKGGGGDALHLLLQNIRRSKSDTAAATTRRTTSRQRYYRHRRVPPSSLDKDDGGGGDNNNSSSSSDDSENDIDSHMSIEINHQKRRDTVVEQMSLLSSSDDDAVAHANYSDDEYDESPAAMDPFSSHFCREPFANDDDLTQAIVASQKTTKVSFPSVLQSSPCLEFQISEGTEQLQDETEAMSLFSYNRKVLQQAWKRTNAHILRDTKSRKKSSLSPLQSALYPSLATYKDMFVAAETRENREAIHNILGLHVLNHVLTSRGRIQRNNKRAKEDGREQDDDKDKLRDQGFTRPTVLILLPTRGTCHTFFNKLLALLDNPAHVDNKDRFEQEYGPPQIDEEEDAKTRQRKKKVLEAKGTEWQELFGEETNDDDDFKIGISVVPKTVSSKDGAGVSVKLYSDFYRSDIIVASPLGLKMSLDGDDHESSVPSSAADADFLSSIEICLVAHSSVLLMQNWDHVNFVLECLNQQPKKNNDTDFGRVRNYLLGGQAKYWRQLILCSSLSDPHIVSTFKRHAKSTAGRLKLRRRTTFENASLCSVLVRVKQVFQ